jgi:hypothetical protein
MPAEAVAGDRIPVTLARASVHEGLGHPKELCHVRRREKRELAAPGWGRTADRYRCLWRFPCCLHAAIELYWSGRVYLRKL